MTTEPTTWLHRIIDAIGRFRFRELPRPAHAVCLRRWANILVLSLAGLVFVMVIELTLGTQVRRLAESWAGAGLPAIAIIMLFGLALACVPLAGIGGLHRRQLRRIPVYPPAWMSVVLAAVAMFALERSGLRLPLPKFSGETWLWAIGIGSAAPLMCVVGGKLLRSSVPIHAGNTRQRNVGIGDQTLRALTDDMADSFIPWLEQEQPVEIPDRDDLFDLRYVAERIAEYLFDVRLATVGLVGPFGVGKSSIIGFVKHYIDSDGAFHTRMKTRWREQFRRGNVAERHAPHILLCSVSAWGLRDQPGAAVILRHAVERLAAEVDCLSVSNLPDQYVQALKGVSPEWLNLPTMLPAPGDAEDQLRRLEPILDAINARLIVIVEDLDRNVEVPVLTLLSQDIESPGRDAPTRVSTRLTTQSSGRIARELEALFSRLLDLERVSFVLVVANAGAADISRLCERIEPVHRIERGLVLRVVGAFRTHCLALAEERGDVQPAHESTLNFLGALHEWRSLDLDMLNGRTPVSALAEVLITPRALKQAMRHTWHAWNDLHGEVDFDDLLICHVIRAVSPSAFDFLMENYGALSADTRDAKQRDEITSAWNAQIRDCSLDGRERLWILVGFLFPAIAVASRSPSPPQGVRRTVYWERVIRGRVAERVRDQDVLRAVATWKRDRGETLLASKLAADTAFAEGFERVIEGYPRAEFSLTHAEYRRLTSQVVAIGIREHHAESCDDAVPGFIPLWRSARALQENDGVGEWLWEEIEKAFPCSLAMANDLEYYWGDDKRTRFPKNEREQIRSRTIAWAREHMTAEMLAQNLGRTDPAALYQFVTRRHVDSAREFEAQSWRWLVPRLIGAMGIAPNVVTRQVCLLLSRSRSGRDRDASKQWHGVTGHELDKSLLEELAPQETERKALLERLAAATGPTDEDDSQMRSIVQGVCDDARRVLEDFRIGSAQASPAGQSESLTHLPEVEIDVQETNEGRKCGEGGLD